MGLQELPLEIFREVLLHSVNARCFERVLRLRLVSHLFAEEVHIALFDSQVLRSLLQEPSALPLTTRNPHHDQFWQSYLLYTIYKNVSTLQGPLHSVYSTAQRLAQRVGDSSPDTVREYISALCATHSYLLLKSEAPCADNEQDQVKHLLQAAIINNEATVVREILQDPDTPGSILDEVTDLWLSPLELAGRGGNREIMRALFTTRRFKNLAEMREEALKGAVAEGRLQTVTFICDAQWGPMDFFSSAHCIEDHIVSGAVRSELCDFSQQVFTLLRSRATARYPIEIHEPDKDQLLHDIAVDARQRVDVVECMLHRGEIIQDAQPAGLRHVHRLIAKFPGEYVEVHAPWNPLRQAVKGSNEKVVKLLLERGALANASGNDTLHWAVRTGCLRNVRLLVDHGVDVNHIPQWPTEPRMSRTPMSPIAEAICLEQDNVARYLHEHGATLASTLDDINELPTQQALKEFPDSKWRLAMLLSQCERGEENCGGHCSWKSKCAFVRRRLR